MHTGHDAGEQAGVTLHPRMQHGERMTRMTDEALLEVNGAGWAWKDFLAGVSCGLVLAAGVAAAGPTGGLSLLGAAVGCVAATPSTL